MGCWQSHPRVCARFACMRLCCCSHSHPSAVNRTPLCVGATHIHSLCTTTAGPDPCGWRPILPSLLCAPLFWTAPH